jgi:Helix-turn-helix domain
MQSNPLFSEGQAANYLGNEEHPFSVRTLQRWRVEGIGPKFAKLGQSVRYRQSDLDAYLEGCIRQSTSESGAD